MKKLLIITLLCSLNVFGQYKLEGSAGISYPVYTYNYEGEIYRYWKLGLNVGANGNIKMINNIHIIPSLRYHYFFFNKFIQEVRFDDKAIHSSGNGSHVLRLGSDINIWDKDDIYLSPYIILGGGYTIEKYGTMKITWKNVNDEIYTTEHKYADRNYWYFGYGLGVKLNISSDFVVRTSLKSYMNKIKRQDFDKSYESCWMLDCSIIYTIIK